MLWTLVFLLPAAPVLAHPGHDLAGAAHSHFVVLAGADGMLPIAVVLGIGALTWLWNQRPMPTPVGARKPPAKGGDGRKR